MKCKVAGLATVATVAAAMLALAPSALADPCQTGGAASFTFVGGERCFTVPAGATIVQVNAVGAPGGGGGSSGFGAAVSGELAVTGGETLFVEVGGSGSAVTQSAAAGFNGGGAPGAASAAGGGGASDIRTCSTSNSCPSLGTASDPRVLVAGGGGGSSGSLNCSPTPGAGGSAGPTPAAGSAGSSTGAPGNIAGGGGGGGAGTASAGGTAGTAGTGTVPAGVAGNPGVAGTGGAGGNASGSGGGGGGGGFFGGGGGGDGGRNTNGLRGCGGGGGAGSSLVPAGGTIATDATGVPSVTITVSPTGSVAPAGLSFGTQAQGTLGQPQKVTITNNSPVAMTVAGFTFAGTNPGDFLVEADTCHAPLAAGSSCQALVAFVPHGSGARTATLNVLSDAANGPFNEALSGTGGTLPQGPAGPAGPKGATGKNGHNGKNGKNGAPGKVEIVTCRSVTKLVTVHGKRHRTTVQQCTTKLLSGSVTLAGSQATAARLTRGHTLYASGVAFGKRPSRSLLLVPSRRLTRGVYVLTLTRRHGRRVSTTRQRVTIV